MIPYDFGITSAGPAPPGQVVSEATGHWLGAPSAHDGPDRLPEVDSKSRFPEFSDVL